MLLQTIGVIGSPMEFGLTHYSIGIRADMDPKVTLTLPYWLNIVMSCSPDECPDSLATLYEGRGGNGTECGYVQFPEETTRLPTGTIIGFSMLSIPIVLLFGFGFHWMRLKRRHRLVSKEHAKAEVLAVREREVNAFIASEVQKPLATAKFALEEVYGRALGKSADMSKKTQRVMVKRKLDTITSSLESISALVGGLGKDRPQEAAPGEMQMFDQVLERFSSHRSLDCLLDGMVLTEEEE